MAESLPPPAEAEFRVLNVWSFYSDAPNALYKNFIDEAIPLLAARKSAVARLESRADWERYRDEARKKIAEVVGPYPEKNSAQRARDRRGEERFVSHRKGDLRIAAGLSRHGGALHTRAAARQGAGDCVLQRALRLGVSLAAVSNGDPQPGKKRLRRPRVRSHWAGRAAAVFQSEDRSLRVRQRLLDARTLAAGFAVFPHRRLACALHDLGCRSGPHTR